MTDGYNIVRSALATNKKLLNRPDLKVNIQTITLAPGVAEQDTDDSDTHPVDTPNLAAQVRKFQARPMPEVDPSEVYHSIIDS